MRRYPQQSRLLPIVPGDLSARIGLGNQCKRWLPKQYHQSVRRPEIREDFRHTQSHFLRAQKLPSGFWALQRAYQFCL